MMLLSQNLLLLVCVSSSNTSEVRAEKPASVQII